jgi:hypothetical protein
MAGRGQVSWLPGNGRPHLPGVSVSPPVADATCACGFLRPVTVAGPRRLRTGLPLTTDRMSQASLSAAGVAARAGSPSPSQLPCFSLEYYADNAPHIDSDFRGFGTRHRSCCYRLRGAHRHRSRADRSCASNAAKAMSPGFQVDGRRRRPWAPIAPRPNTIATPHALLNAPGFTARPSRQPR